MRQGNIERKYPAPVRGRAPLQTRKTYFKEHIAMEDNVKPAGKAKPTAKPKAVGKRPSLWRIFTTIGSIVTIGVPKVYFRHREEMKEAKAEHKKTDATGEDADAFLKALQPGYGTYDQGGRTIWRDIPYYSDVSSEETLEDEGYHNGVYKTIPDRNLYKKGGQNAAYFHMKNVYVPPLKVGNPDHLERGTLVDERMLRKVDSIKAFQNEDPIRNPVRRRPRGSAPTAPKVSYRAIPDPVPSPTPTDFARVDRYMGRRPECSGHQYTGGFQDRYKADLAWAEIEYESTPSPELQALFAATSEMYRSNEAPVSARGKSRKRMKGQDDKCPAHIRFL